MNLKQRFILTIRLAVLALALIIFFAILIYAQMQPPDEYELIVTFVHKHFWIVVLPPAGLLLLLGWAVHWFGDRYLVPLNKITEDTGILVVNPSHRITVPQSETLQRLAASINATADHFDELRQNIEQNIEKANEALAEEKNILLTLIAKLNEGILVCNRDCNILLYNERAGQIFMRTDTQSGSESQFGSMIGLGRSLLGIIDPRLVQHALDEVMHRISRENSAPVSQFVTTGSSNQLLRVQLAPILDNQKNFDGFLLVLYDITQKVKRDSQRDMLLQVLSEGIRASVAGIRAAIETVIDYPSMSAAERENFQKTIHSESLMLSTLINKTTSDFSEHFKAHWPLEQMLCPDLLAAIQRAATERLNINISLESCEESIWINVDSYSLTQAYLFILHELKQLIITDFSFRIERKNHFVNVDLAWQSKKFPRDVMQDWKSQFLLIDNEGIMLTLQEVLDRHDAEIWSKSDPENNEFYLRLLLPAIPEPVSIPVQIMPDAESRPEYYDFDLFNRPGQMSELDDVPLSELSFTVFDTETTGLNPSDGDEIISVGAIRIVNGRMLRREVFDQLVDPRRTLSRESIKVHGISPEMLVNQPTIDRVLPAFHDYAKKTVLVAHNAAFDMRFLQIKEENTGVKFVNPVLDTLLLSAFVHPNQDKHSLDEVAKRLGVTIIGRHTALGDSLVTAEVFLKLLPLLAKKGVRTLREAREASQKTFYARLKY